MITIIAKNIVIIGFGQNVVADLQRLSQDHYRLLTANHCFGKLTVVLIDLIDNDGFKIILHVFQFLAYYLLLSEFYELVEPLQPFCGVDEEMVRGEEF